MRLGRRGRGMRSGCVCLATRETACLVRFSRFTRFFLLLRVSRVSHVFVSRVSCVSRCAVLCRAVHHKRARILFAPLARQHKSAEYQMQTPNAEMGNSTRRQRFVNDNSPLFMNHIPSPSCLDPNYYVAPRHPAICCTATHTPSPPSCLDPNYYVAPRHPAVCCTATHTPCHPAVLIPTTT